MKLSLLAVSAAVIGLVGARSYQLNSNHQQTVQTPVQSTAVEDRCADMAAVARVAQQFGEIPLFRARKGFEDPIKNAQDITTLITLNPKTGTWSQFDIDINGVACFVGQGVLAEVLLGNPT